MTLDRSSEERFTAAMRPAGLATPPPGTILLTGATGYVGSHLLARLLQLGMPVRCLTRRPRALPSVPDPRVEVAVADLLDPSSLDGIFRDVRVAYYLVHSMGSEDDFAAADRLAATHFAAAARRSGLRRIVYLGGLGAGDALSAHLASRHEVGEILRGSGVPTVELRSSIVIGPGSASFETVRAIVERMPYIPAPATIHTATQPIAIDDVIEYLVSAAVVPAADSLVAEIGGPDRVTYAELLREYARQRRLRRSVVALPMRQPGPFRAALRLLIPTHGRVAAAMFDSLRNETVVRHRAAGAALPVSPRGLSQSIERALQSEDRAIGATLWSDAPGALPSRRARRWGGVPWGHRRVSSQVVRVQSPGEIAFGQIQRLGGRTGWCGIDWFWRARGWLDRAAGGNGFRRTRRHPVELAVGDQLDFWRVAHLQPGRLVALTNEMRMPGRLSLHYEIEQCEGGTQIRQTTVFDPVGCLGRLYWHLLYPVHLSVFRLLLRNLGRRVAAASVL